mgnify:CR=1 FL=1
MKQVLLFSLLNIGTLTANNRFSFVEKMNLLNNEIHFAEGYEKMLANVFRAQDFCRAEVKDFEWDVHFRIVSATIYFSGTNFKNVETGFINSSSLKPIRSLMDRCAPGTMVVFDHVKVKGPDEVIRSVPGPSFRLH